MTREEAIENLIAAAYEYKESKVWADQNSSKLLSSSITGEEAAEVMRYYFDKETNLLDAITVLEEIDGLKNTNATKRALEDLEINK